MEPSYVTTPSKIGSSLRSRHTVTKLTTNRTRMDKPCKLQTPHENGIAYVVHTHSDTDAAPNARASSPLRLTASASSSLLLLAALALFTLNLPRSPHAPHRTAESSALCTDGPLVTSDLKPLTASSLSHSGTKQLPRGWHERPRRQPRDPRGWPR